MTAEGDVGGAVLSDDDCDFDAVGGTYSGRYSLAVK